MRSAVVALAACTGHHAESVRPQVTFCAAIVAGDRSMAGRVAHQAMIDAGANKLPDASEPLAAWLRTQPCVAEVTVSTLLIDTEPAIREIAFALVPDDAGVARACTIHLRATRGARVDVTPADDTKNNPDRRCSPR
jgi:hypothetical protein